MKESKFNQRTNAPRRVFLPAGTRLALSMIPLLALYGCNAKPKAEGQELKKDRPAKVLSPLPSPQVKQSEDKGDPREAISLPGVQRTLIDAKIRAQFGPGFRGKALDTRRSGAWVFIAGEIVDHEGARATAQALGRQSAGTDTPIDNVFFALITSEQKRFYIAEWSAGATDLPTEHWIEKHALPEILFP